MVVSLHAANPGPFTGSGNWTYFLPGRHPVLIDAGVGNPEHLDALARARADGPAHVLVSHGHSDHVSGVTAIGTRWPQTRFSKYAWPDHDERYAVAWHGLADGQVLEAGDDVLQVVHTPGHAPDHVAFWHAESRTLFSGDLVVAGTTVVIPASSGGSLAAYLASLGRILDLSPAKLLPAHGPAIDEPADAIRRYIQHRHEREGQVLSALKEGVDTVDAIVGRVYTGLAPALVRFARESVLAHLIKLEHEGIARRVGDEWVADHEPPGPPKA
ncbi:MAG: MBL fold metallo-hydrolase [Acidobacteriota bacterium]